MHISTLGADDAPAYRALMLHAYAAVPDAFTSTAEERAALPDTWWVQRLADPKALSVVLGAFHDNRLVGTAALEFSERSKTQHKAHLIGMFVDEACRGLGTGTRLVEGALAVARARVGVRVVTLTVTEGNAAALALYAHCGFRAFGTEPMAIATPAGYLTKVHMYLPLDETGAA